MKTKVWRPGLGPVFVYEWITSSRRWQTYAQRSLFAVMVLAAMAVIWMEPSASVLAFTLSGLAVLGERLFLSVMGTQLVLVMLVAPAATAGAICLDRARGTLSHMLVTDLSNSEIVLGKLAARLVPVVGLVASTLPMMALLTLLGGVDPDALLGAFIVIVGVAILGCSVAFFFSLWVGKTHEALLSTYTVWGLWLLSPVMIFLLNRLFGRFVTISSQRADPFFLAFAPYWWPGSVEWSDYVRFLVVTSSISAMLVSVAVLRIRSIPSRDGVRQQSHRSRWPGVRRVFKWFDLTRHLPAPSLDTNPILWREWHRSRTSGWARSIFAIYIWLAAIFTVVAIRSPQPGIVAAYVNAIQVFVGLLLLSVTAATSLADERIRGSLDVVMATPLSAGQIVLGKWLGTFRKVLPLVVLPALAILFTGLTDRRRVEGAFMMVAFVLCCGAAITSLGLLMATWIPQIGRAVGATIFLFVAVNIGWYILVIILGGPGRPRDKGELLGSPIAWALLVTAASAGHTDAPGLPPWTIFWVFVYAFVAVVLLAATLMTFDGCLGRASRINPRRRPARAFQIE
jgi:ABC-type transport system involved in multi-copper enzyme maturation permease subunit